MLDVFKRWFACAPAATPWSDVAQWAQTAGHVFKRARTGEGFVVDGSFEGRAWRLEWSLPQRSYIEGHELRMRMELGLPSVLQMLVLSRPLMESLERESFERFTEMTQTRIDVATSEEMRWLAMFHKADLPASRNVKERFAAVSNDPRLVSAWVEGALAAQLDQAAASFLLAEPPFVVMSLRGRIYLRMQLAVPTASIVDSVVALYSTACLEALRVAGGLPHAPGGWTSTASTAWHSQLHTEVREPPKR